MNTRLLACTLALALAACGTADDGTTVPPRADAYDASTRDVRFEDAPPVDALVTTDTGLDSTAVPDLALTDATANPPDDLEAPPAPDATAEVDGPDVFVAWPDATPEAGLAWVWDDPARVLDDSALVMAPLLHRTAPDGRLTGLYANVTNCLPKPGGLSTEFDVNGLTLTASLCLMEQTVTPDPDGNYLSVRPPRNPTAPGDPFAEAQMYFHVNRVHDYFKDVHGFTERDAPLRAVVNVMVGLTLAGTAWMSIDNAAFIPREGLAQIGDMLGVAPPFDEDAIVFAQGPTADFAYDGDVVYHEYTHAVVGGGRLQGIRVDPLGLDTWPLSLNEAYADYFTAALTEDPVIGGFSLGLLDAARDLREVRTCPGDTVGESHFDGQVFSSALWALRGELGGATTDALVFDALLGFGPLTSLEEAAAAVEALAAELSPPEDARVHAVFERHGIPGCQRVKALESAGTDAAFVAGLGLAGADFAASGVPAYVQTSFALAEAPAYLTLSWELGESGMGDLLGLVGMTEEPPVLDVALKPTGEALAPIVWSYEEGIRSDAAAVLPLTANGSIYSVVIAGSCLTTGRHTIQFVNRASPDAYLYGFAAVPSDTPPEGATIRAYDCPSR